MGNLAAQVAASDIVDAEGLFQRHSSPRVVTLVGSVAGGRWGAPGAFPVLYLGRPLDSVVAEAYRHLVDDVEGMTGDLVAPRKLWTCQVKVTQVLDLRTEKSRSAVGISLDELVGAVDDYTHCQRIAQAAHQLQLHGIIAPAATRLGETLALFQNHLPANELPTVVNEVIWEHLPVDPRSARALKLAD